MPAVGSEEVSNNSKEGWDHEKLAAVIAAAMFACGAASASDKTDAIAIVHKWVDAFNKSDGKTGSSYCAGGAIVSKKRCHAPTM